MSRLFNLYSRLNLRSSYKKSLEQVTHLEYNKELWFKSKNYMYQKGIQNNLTLISVLHFARIIYLNILNQHVNMSTLGDPVVWKLLTMNTNEL